VLKDASTLPRERVDVSSTELEPRETDIISAVAGRNNGRRRGQCSICIDREAGQLIRRGVRGIEESSIRMNHDMVRLQACAGIGNLDLGQCTCALIHAEHREGVREDVGHIQRLPIRMHRD